MNGAGIEPRTVLWARAEVSWVDASGAPHHAPAAMEDTSPSGACVRVGTEIDVGSNLTVKRHGEEFSGTARNRRREGHEFLVGIQRNKAGAIPPEKSPKEHVPARQIAPPVEAADKRSTSKARKSLALPPPDAPAAINIPKPSSTEASSPATMPDVTAASKNAISKSQPLEPVSPLEPASPRTERNVMEPTPLLRKLWPRQIEPAAVSDIAVPAEVPVSKPGLNLPEPLPEPKSALLSCEDIYRASGILGARSKYDINKIVEMLNSKHIRELPKEVRKASVLMALDAAGTTVDEVLNDAARRQHALNSYEGGQQKEFEQFEAGKLRENAQIKLEMERVAAHYEERIQRNFDHVAREKEAFRTWQAAKEQESQRISEAVALCSRQAAPEPSHDAPPALAKSATAGSGAAGPADSTTGGLAH